MRLPKLLFVIPLLAVLKVNALNLTIPSYPVESVIPDDYTFNSGGSCSGQNISPQLVWDDVPAGTVSFAVVFIDENFNFLHWKLFNIDPDVTHIPEDNPNSVGTEGLTNFGINGYGGPCPPSPTPGNYRMTVYALNTTFASDPSVAQIQAAAIESASWLAFRNINDSQDRYEYSARYRLTFNAEWSSASHPIDFPPNAHFSPLIGNTHTADGFIWDAGVIATDGVEEMAETGATNLLSDEIRTLTNTGGTEHLIPGPGADGVDTVMLEFEMSDSHPLFSMVTMIAPSPDWFIGVHDLQLMQGGLWVDNLSVELLPYDAGTDSGSTFLSGDADTVPRDPIQRLTVSPFPNNVPLGRFVFELISTQGTPSGSIFVDGFESRN